MRRSAKEAFEEKAEEMKNELQAWLKKRRILEVGEIVVIDIRVEIIPTVRIDMPKRGKRTVRCVFDELTEKDWMKIMELHFPASMRAVLDLIHKKGNQSVPAGDIDEMFKKKFGSRRDSYMEAINSCFSKNRYPYRLRYCAEGVRNSVQVFKIENS